jgi:serine/threonine protein phosphatase PrpC
MEAWGLTDPGMVREQNQDSYDIVQMEDGALLAIVCDGMGGAKSGNVASKLACEVFVNELQRVYRHGAGEDAVRKALLDGASLANSTVYEQSRLGPDFQGMGTTLVAALIWPELALVANIGDSRAYRLNQDGIRRITTDHSVVEDMVRRGELTPQQARSHPRKNLITRAVGTEPEVQCDLFRQPLRPGDSLILCSDGLSNVVSEQEMLFEVVHGVQRDSCCQRLITIANNAGAPDNVTVILVTV